MILLTGMPKTGKTTLIRQLSRSGFSYLEESASTHPNYENVYKLSSFSHWFVRKQLEQESTADERTLCDRGLWDQVAFCEYFGRPVPEMPPLAGRYSPILFLTALPGRRYTDWDYAFEAVLRRLLADEDVVDIWKADRLAQAAHTLGIGSVRSSSITIL